MVVNLDKYIDASEASLLSGGFAVAPISISPALILPITAVTAPTLSSLPGSAIVAQDHADAATVGAQFEFQVPDDYDSGSLTLSIVYAMSTAVGSPNNTCILEVGAEIAKASDGSIDTGTYPLGSVGITTPDNLTDVIRSPTILTISSADFAAGDKVLFFVKRLGSDGSDLHTGVLQIVDYIVTYSGQVAARRSIQNIEVFTDSDEGAPPAGTKSSFNTLDFTTGVDDEQQFQFTIPDHWDGFSDFHVQFTYAMSTAAVADVLLETEVEIADSVGGSVSVLGVESHTITTTSDTDVHRTVVVRAVPGAGRTAGDTILVKIARRGTSGSDTHGGDWQLIGGTVAVGVGPSTAVSQLSEFYMSDPFVNQVAGTTSSVDEGAILGGDFEQYVVLSSTAASSQINLEYAGRLASVQTTITDVRIPIKGSAGSDYQIKVYAEGQGATPVYDSGLTSAPVTRTEIVVISGDIVPQPASDKRYFVVIEAHIDAGESLRVGRPFVRQG